MEHIGRRINIASRKVRHTVDKLQANTNISPSQTRILGYLAKHGYAYQGDFEKILNVRRSSISSLIGSLEQKGYVSREADEKDTRKKIIRITEEGREIERITYSKTIVRLEEELYYSLTDEQRDAFLESLDIIADTLDKIQEEGLDD